MKSITKTAMLMALAAMTLAACGGGSSSNSGSGSSGSSASNNSAANYTLGGTVAGLNGGSLMLSNNGGSALAVNANGSFTFPTMMSGNASYSVTVAQQPRGQVCTVSNASGAGVVANVSTVAVTCAAQTYTIAGSVSGLAAGQSIVLQNNGADAQTIAANGAFTFATPVAANSSYAITVASQPAGQVCTVSNGSGSGVVANIGNVSVSCSTDTYTIGGNVGGLASGQQVTLLNNGADPQIVTANGVFAFATPVVFNGSYAVTVGTHPTGQTCTVSNNSGAGVVANIANVAVTCSANTYTVSGAVSGLASGQQVTLNDNGSDALTINANGSFSFATPIVFNGSYVVTVGTQPLAQTCTVTNATGAGMVTNITNVVVNCASTTYSVSGTVVGLSPNQQVTILNNGGNPITLSNTSNVTFAIPVVSGGSYLITVGTQPTTQTCSASNGSGGPVTGNVSGVFINCSGNVLQVGGSVSGLSSGQQVTLDLNGAEPLTVTANGPFSFGNVITYGSNYSVTVGTQPVGQSCTVTNGSGSNVTAGIGNVSVTCSTATETVLYSFTGISGDGALPLGGLTLGNDGNFYGFASNGGAHIGGAFYKITPAGSETVLYSFGSFSGDGTKPIGAPVLGSDGNFYGVTQVGGINNNGTIVKITPAGVETLLYSFGTISNDGIVPGAGLAQGADGNFYGTTMMGGTSTVGTVFKITPGGTYTQLYSFNVSTGDAVSPQAPLVQGSDGNFYGTGYYGGINGDGAVFKITPAGAETVLYSFAGTSSGDGKYPAGAMIIGSDGNFYGTTYKGGIGYGTAFKMTPAGSVSVLYAFGSSDAQEPNGALVQGADGNFYGITQYGGANHDGTLFKLTSAGVETVLWSFGGSGDGQQPYGNLLIGSDGYLYGTTANGGGSSLGTVYRY